MLLVVVVVVAAVGRCRCRRRCRRCCRLFEAEGIRQRLLAVRLQFALDLLGDPAVQDFRQGRRCRCRCRRRCCCSGFEGRCRCLCFLLLRLGITVTGGATATATPCPRTCPLATFGGVAVEGVGGELDAFLVPLALGRRGRGQGQGVTVAVPVEGGGVGGRGKVLGAEIRFQLEVAVEALGGGVRG